MVFTDDWTLFEVAKRRDLINTRSQIESLNRLTVKFLQRVRPALWFRGQLVDDRFQLVVNLRRFVVEHLLGGEQRLQVCDQEEYPGVV